MECFKVENLSFIYPKRNEYALYNVNFSVNRGEFVTICGKSGCGKTTLLRLLKPSLAPSGVKEGKILFLGNEAHNLKEQTAKIGFLMQSPDSQIVTDKVWHELAFGLESLGYSTPEIRIRVSEMASFFGIQNWFYKDVSSLSGGQKQLLNLASVMAMSPDVLILDEPTSQLDPIAAEEFINTLKKINRELGTTVIISEHRLEEVLSASHRMIIMDKGQIIYNDAPRYAGEFLKIKNNDMFLSLPAPLRISSLVEKNLPSPLTVCEGREWLYEYSKTHILNKEAKYETERLAPSNDIIVELKDVWYKYERELPDVIKGLDLRVKKGEHLCILGGNGVGKTTLLSLISGLSSPYRGKVLICKKEPSQIRKEIRTFIGFLPQNPELLFSKKTGREELLEMVSDSRTISREKEAEIKKVAELCKVDTLLEYHPYDLSGGEKQRLALAKLLLMYPEVLLLDEPTKGIDAGFKEILADIISKLLKKGITVITVSHDIEFSAKNADRCALMFDGNITSEGAPREFFKGKSFYTTSTNRMARDLLPDAILAEDVILACGGNEKIDFKDDNGSSSLTISDDKKEEGVIKNEKKEKKNLLPYLMILLLVPLTIWGGITLFCDRKYYFVSILIILEVTFFFFSAFEGRKPKARELVIISVMCALAVAGRSAFFMLPQFKPTLAIIILTGVAFGGEAGFLTGAVCGFVSNFFFGQGPWTPWHMFAFGIIGFLSGVVFKSGAVPKGRLSLGIFGALSAFVLYGVIMNLSAVFMHQSNPSFEMIMAALISGASFDLIHAVSTALFLFALSKPVLEKLERVKVKYGLT